MKCNRSDSRGFIALLSVLFLSTVLLAAALAADYSAYVAHEAVNDEIAYRQAQQNALSCARFAFSRLDADSLRFFQTPPTLIPLTDEGSCLIQEASTSKNDAGVLVSGAENDSVVPLYVSATRVSSTSPFLPFSWTEY